MINETLKTKHDPVGVHAEAVAQFEGYEHAHWALQYRGEAIRAGFVNPAHRAVLSLVLPRPARGAASAAAPTGARASSTSSRRGPLGRRAYLMWINHIAGGVSFGMIATKPQRPTIGRGRPA